VQCHTCKYVLIYVHHIADTYLNKYVHIISPSKQFYINTYLLAKPVQASRPYMLAKLVSAQQAGLHACKAGTSQASRPTCSPSWYQPSGQVLLLTTGLSGLPGGARTPLDDRDRRVTKRRKPPLDDRYRPVIKRSAYSSQ
jgi:hypothetical protein